MTSEYEPTLHDVIQLMQGMEMRLTTEAQENFRLLSGRIDVVDDRITALDQRLTKVEVRIEDIQDDIRVFLEYADNQTEKIYDHEKRIKKLEVRPA